MVDAINSITKNPSRIVFHKKDILDPCMAEIFSEHTIKAVIHFAGLKSVNESIGNPVDYYSINVAGTLALLKLCVSHQCKFIYSSSAMIYGNGAERYNDNGHQQGMSSLSSPSSLSRGQMIEDHPMGSLPLETNGPPPVTNPYGVTKLMVEKILFDTCKAHPLLNVVSLRYFNTVGSHPSGVLGDVPMGIPNNIMPFIYRVAVYNDKVAKGLIQRSGTNPYSHLKVFGNTFNTPDGTGYRDYIHVVDLAEAHIAALPTLSSEQTKSSSKVPNYKVYNVGTGKPTSVLKLINTFCKANNVNVPFHIVEKRSGDVGVVYCNPDKIYRELGWKSKRTLETMCRDVWKQYSR